MCQWLWRLLLLTALLQPYLLQLFESFPSAFIVFIVAKYLVAKLLPRQGLSPVMFISQIRVALLLFFAVTMWGLIIWLWTSLSIWSSKSDPPHHHGYPSYAYGAEGQLIPLMTFTSFSCKLMYVLVFWRLRWPDETSSCVLFGPDLTTLLLHCIFPTRYPYYILLSHWHWPLRGVSGSKVNANCSCPYPLYRSRIGRVDTNCCS